MGKIKSALELAMERADALAGSVGSNIEESAYDQYTKAAALLASSYLENKVSLERLAESIDNYPAAALPAAKKALLQGITERLNPANCAPVLAAYQKFAPDIYNGEAGAALQEICREYRDQVEKKRSELEQKGGQVLLKESGISGSAIAAINIERTPQWQEGKLALAHQFSQRLERIKQRLLEQL